MQEHECGAGCDHRVEEKGVSAPVSSLEDTRILPQDTLETAVGPSGNTPVNDKAGEQRVSGVACSAGGPRATALRVPQVPLGQVLLNEAKSSPVEWPGSIPRSAHGPRDMAEPSSAIVSEPTGFMNEFTSRVQAAGLGSLLTYAHGHSMTPSPTAYSTWATTVQNTAPYLVPEEPVVEVSAQVSSQVEQSLSQTDFGHFESNPFVGPDSSETPIDTSNPNLRNFLNRSFDAELFRQEQLEFLETFDEDSDDEECPTPTRATSVNCPDPTRATSVEDSSDFIFAVGEDFRKYQAPMIDSGAAHSVCSKWYAEDYALTQERSLNLTHAGGGSLKHLGDSTNVL